jgi:hypothetical protein
MVGEKTSADLILSQEDDQPLRLLGFNHTLTEESPEIEVVIFP